jgi:hypothetical protein
LCWRRCDTRTPQEEPSRSQFPVVERRRGREELRSARARSPTTDNRRVIIRATAPPIDGCTDHRSGASAKLRVKRCSPAGDQGQRTLPAATPHDGPLRCASAPADQRDVGKHRRWETPTLGNMWSPTDKKPPNVTTPQPTTATLGNTDVGKHVVAYRQETSQRHHAPANHRDVGKHVVAYRQETSQRRTRRYVAAGLPRAAGCAASGCEHEQRAELT